MNKGISIFILLLIAILILFDSAQQKYYLETFNLNPEDTVSYIGLLGTHLIRWALWSLTAIPLSIFLWNRFFKTGNLTKNNWIVIGSSYFTFLLFSIGLLSLHSLISQDGSINDFVSFYEFFGFQKGLSFLLASILIVLLLFNQSRIQTISDQGIEIKNLKKKTSDLQEVLNQEETPHLNVKIGYKLTPVALDDIIWIQSDDYCVKIHTEKNTFTLRQSLKMLETKLAPFRFIRIHRSAILNLTYLDQINFETSKVKLLNHSEIPFSKNGLKSLKKNIKDIAE